MKDEKTSPWQSIFTRLLVPLIIGLIGVAWLLHKLTIGTVESMIQQHMQEKMHWMSGNVFEICHSNFEDFLLINAGSRLNHSIVKARTLAGIEDYMETHDLSGVILENGETPALVHDLPFDQDRISTRTENLPVISMVSIDGQEFIAGQINFEPWDWEIILLQNVRHYQSMVQGLRHVYLGVVGILCAGIVFILILVVVNVSRPLTRIINRVRQEKPPEYRGVAEFTYLSRAVARMMNSIQQQKDFIASLFESLSVIVVVVDSQGRASMVNRHLCDLTGFRREEVINRYIWDLLPSSKARMVKNLFQRHKKGHVVEGEEMSILTRDRKKLDILWHSRLIFDQKSCLEWIIYTGSDITRLKKTEKSLEKERLLIYSLFESSPLAQMVMDRQGKVLDVNEQFTTLTGWSVRNITCLASWLASIAWDQESLNSLNNDWRRAMLGEKVAGKAAIKGRQGDYMQVEFIYSPMPDGRVVCFLKDMTEKERQEEENRRMEKELHQARKMEAVGVLAGGIAHDFNNILQAISGQAQMMERTHGYNPNVSKGCARIIDLVRRGVSLVRGILTFSRKVDPELTIVDINDLVSREIRIMRHTLPRMLELAEDLDQGAGNIYADQQQMELVVMTLVKNAADAITGTGRIVIYTARIELDGHDERYPGAEAGTHVLVQVKDNGSGMDEQTMDKMYDPFYTTKEQGKGTGLGLPTVYGIIKKHSGHIFCFSKPGEGTEFSILLPPADESVQAEAEKEAEQIPGRAPAGREKVLVVDDEDDIREVTMEMLESYGYKAVGAASGEEALKVYQSDDIDLVIMDLGMPGMGGEECSRKLVSTHPGVRILVASGYLNHPMAARPEDFKISGFISKPYNLEVLLNKVRNILDQA
ncbi:MAG: PAS domain S-box protein [Desulfonatronovibrionaceae bacterium]